MEPTQPMLLEASAAHSITAVSRVRIRAALRGIFSFPVVLAILLLVVTIFSIRERFNDPDLWWHLKTGEIIWNTRHIPIVDSFSFTTNNHPYTPHEWLSQLTIYGAYDLGGLGGYTGLMLWFCAAASILIVAAYMLCAVYSGNAKVAFLGGLLVWLFSTVGLSIRPQMLGYVFLVFELLILEIGRARDARWFLAMPPLFALWVNCHGSFFFGLIVLAAFLFCSFIRLRAGLLVSQRWEKRPRNILALASVLSIPCLFLNPIGLKQVVYPLDTLLTQTQQMKGVSEWLPATFNDFRGAALLAVTGLILLVPLIRRIELTIQELMLAAFGFGLAALHVRMMFVFGILAAPILCRLLATAWDQYQPDRDRPVLNAILIALSLLVAVIAFPNRLQLDRQVTSGNPVKAVQFINGSGLSGNMLNEYGYGGYLIWAAPQHKVFVDGRGDVFEWAGVLEEYFKWQTLRADPNALLNKYHINFCLLSRDSPMSRVLPLLPGWKTVYSDDSSSVFARAGALTR